MIRERFLPTEGIHNFRDYGGYQASGGRVKQGLLYRSGQHVGASDADLAMIAGLGLRTVIDFRGNSERESHPCRRPEGFDARVVFFDGETTNAPPHMDLGEGGVTEAHALERMRTIYRRMPHNPAMHVIFGDYFRALDERDGASLVHCFAGKDRTGIAVALLQHVLGVHRDDIAEEYLLTNNSPTVDILVAQSVPRIEERYGKVEDGAIDALMRVKAEYLDSFVDETIAAHGSLEHFLGEVLGVDAQRRERLRTRFIA